MGNCNGAPPPAKAPCIMPQKLELSESEILTSVAKLISGFSEKSIFHFEDPFEIGPMS